MSKYSDKPTIPVPDGELTKIDGKVEFKTFDQTKF